MKISKRISINSSIKKSKKSSKQGTSFDSAMKKSKKRSRKQGIDRLSNLDDKIIIEILGMLPMVEAVRTTTLSKRWENVWTTTPYLNFEGHGSELVNQALRQWRGLKILRLGLSRDESLDIDCDESLDSDCDESFDIIDSNDSWSRLAIEKGVEKGVEVLHLYDLKFTNNVYACSSLKEIKLYGCNLQNPQGKGNVQWNQLTHLWLHNCVHDGDLINQVVCGSPQLEVFALRFEDRFEFSGGDMSIRSSSLRELWIDRNLNGRFRNPSSEITIWTPNLETLDIGGVPYAKYCFLMNDAADASSLTHLRLDFHDYFLYKADFSMKDDAYLENILGQIFPTVQHVEKLTLTDWCIEVLVGAMKDKYLWNDAKLLTIERMRVDYDKIIDLLQNFPTLETLVVKYKWTLEPILATGNGQAKRNLPDYFLVQVRRVEIDWIVGDDLIFPFIEFLLKHASKLQKMVFRVRRLDPPSSEMVLALQKLLRIPRSSPTAELIFADYVPS